MNILLRIINISAKKELFIDEYLKAYSKDKIIAYTLKQKDTNLFFARKNGEIYLRSKPNDKIIDNISNKSISHTKLILFYKNYLKATSDQKIKDFDRLRRKKQIKSYIIVRDNRGDFVSTKTISDVKKHILKYKNIIFASAARQNINPALLGAILIDEYCRMGWDDWLDWLGALGVRNTSVGIAQIKLSTAREIIKKRYYNPAPLIITLKSPAGQIYVYLNQPKHSILFAAAAIRLSIDFWAYKKVDISKQNKILAHLYSSGYTKDIRSATTKRCSQISTEFYQTAKSILK